MEWAMDLSSAQVRAGLRHVATASVTAATVLGTLGLLSADQTRDIISGLQQLGNGLQDVFGGASKVIIILGPIAAGWIAKVAVTSASLKSQLTAISQNKQVQIDGKIIVPESVANEVPSNKVVGPSQQGS
jgi:Mn2+/Fe2+ NRAMP family transporter